MIFGIGLDKDNPTYTVEDFKFWMPKLATYVDTADGTAAFEKFYPLANQKIFKSIFGSDWEYAMSLAIAHYMMLRAKQLTNTNDGTPAGIAANDDYNFILNSVSVGSFSKGFDTGSTLINSDDAKFWNLTSFGALLMALYKTKYAPSIFVVTPTTVPLDPIKRYYENQIMNSMAIQMQQMQQEIDELREEIENNGD